MDQAAIDEEVELLRQKITELGTVQEDGKIGIAFAELYDKTQEIFEVRVLILYDNHEHLFTLLALLLCACFAFIYL